MGDRKKLEKSVDVSAPLSKKELLLRQWRKAVKEKIISRTRAGVVRNQVIRSYEILEDIRLDYLGDTAFREKLVNAKNSLESMINDFLLSDMYWEGRIKQYQKMTPKEYDNWIKQPFISTNQSKVSKK